MAENPLQQFIENTREQIQQGDTQNALDALNSYLSGASQKLKNEASLYTAQYNRLRRDERKGLLTRESADAKQAQLENSLLGFLDEIPKRFDRAASPVPALVSPAEKFPAAEGVAFQKILGINNLKQISWIQRGVELSKSVCRILTPDGFGTGFLIGDDRLMTNNHVLPTTELANQSYAEFNYQQDTTGKHLPTVRLRLSGATFHTSPKNELDYSVVGFAAQRLL